MDQFKQMHPGGDPMENLRNMVSQMFSNFGSIAPLYLVCMVPVTYLGVNWLFTLPLIVDKKMGFWTAMKTSWKMVHKHWFHVFGLMILLGIINLAGFCACCVGLLVTGPLCAAVLMFAYEDIFGRKIA